MLVHQRVSHMASTFLLPSRDCFSGISSKPSNHLEATDVGWFFAIGILYHMDTNIDPIIYVYTYTYTYIYIYITYIYIHIYIYVTKYILCFHGYPSFTKIINLSTAPWVVPTARAGPGKLLGPFANAMGPSHCCWFIYHRWYRIHHRLPSGKHT